MRAALDALPEVARAAGVEKYRVCPQQVAEAELAAGYRIGARLICRGDSAYPRDLSDLPDAPPLLWAMGSVEALQKPMVSLVGARNASSLGIRMARKLAEGLGDAGFVVVSGLARGIDTAAHIASLQTGTVAVMAGGVDVLYPSENTRLAEEIVHNGGVRLSEQPIGMQPVARHFPTRNRIVSGLARAVVVVEAAAKSGSLITAKNALDQGREVLAVPGHPMDARAGGCNMLIRDGARLVRNTDDIIEALPPIDLNAASQQPEFDLSAPPSPSQFAQPQAASSGKPAAATRDGARTLQKAAALHQQILERLGPTPMAEDQLIRDLGAGSGQVSPVLTDLELEGYIRRQPGGLLSLVLK